MTITDEQIRHDQKTETAPVYIAGAGLAALTCALSLAPRPVVIISPTELGHGAASVWAQGGIAAAIGQDDTPALHLQDTLTAGAGLVEQAAATHLTHQAEQAIEFLVRHGVHFDEEESGSFSLGREGAHSRNRILHVGGDATGHGIMQALIKAVRDSAHIEVLEKARLTGVHAQDNRMVALQIGYSDGQQNVKPCASLVLATGGIGGLYARTTAPAQVCGEGHALAALAGAEMADMEFVQFHPTAMDFDSLPPEEATPLATEALRGKGATLINDRGDRIMKGVHDDAELAPRDVVARTIFRELAKGRRVFLDCRQAIGPDFEIAFPTVAAAAKLHGIDPAKDLLPVSPAAHYHMGGIKTDAHGRTSLTGLWACGEVACTGVHGANRLASNSLLEALVMGEQVALDIMTAIPASPLGNLPAVIKRTPDDAQAVSRLRTIMFRCAGLARDAAGLTSALDEIDRLRQSGAGSDLELKAISAQMIVYAALMRQESRGGHFRTDFPSTTDKAQRSAYTFEQVLTGTKEIQHSHSSNQVFPACN